MVISGHSSTRLHTPASVRIGEFVVTGDEEDPVVAKVLEIVKRPGGQKVVMELVGDAEDLLSALTRALCGELAPILCARPTVLFSKS